MALSFHNLLKKGVSRRVLVCKVVKRTIILFGIGLFLNTDGGIIILLFKGICSN